MRQITQDISKLDAAQVRQIREAHGLEDDHAPLAIDWRTLPLWTPEVRECVAVTLHDYALSQTDARDVLRTITRADRRVGVWLACAVARTALRYVSAGEDRPRLAIETAERWARGAATESECRAAVADFYAATLAVAYAAGSAANAASAAADAAYAAYAAARAAYDAARSAATYAASADAYDAADYAYAYDAAYARALRKLCQTIAGAVRDAVDAAAEGYARRSPPDASRSPSQAT